MSSAPQGVGIIKKQLVQGQGGRYHPLKTADLVFAEEKNEEALDALDLQPQYRLDGGLHSRATFTRRHEYGVAGSCKSMRFSIKWRVFRPLFKGNKSEADDFINNWGGIEKESSFHNEKTMKSISVFLLVVAAASCRSRSIPEGARTAPAPRQSFSSLDFVANAVEYGRLHLPVDKLGELNQLMRFPGGRLPLMTLLNVNAIHDKPLERLAKSGALGKKVQVSYSGRISPRAGKGLCGGILSNNRVAGDPWRNLYIFHTPRPALLLDLLEKEQRRLGSEILKRGDAQRIVEINRELTSKCQDQGGAVKAPEGMSWLAYQKEEEISLTMSFIVKDRVILVSALYSPRTVWMHCMHGIERLTHELVPIGDDVRGQMTRAGFFSGPAATFSAFAAAPEAILDELCLDHTVGEHNVEGNIAEVKRDIPAMVRWLKSAPRWFEDYSTTPRRQQWTLTEAGKRLLAQWEWKGRGDHRGLHLDQETLYQNATRMYEQFKKRKLYQQLPNFMPLNTAFRFFWPLRVAGSCSQVKKGDQRHCLKLESPLFHLFFGAAPLEQVEFELLGDRFVASLSAS